jgi:hypothetical protein
MGVHKVDGGVPGSVLQGTEVNSSEQQTNEVLAVEHDAVGVQDTTIAGHQGTTRTCDLHQINTQAPVLIVTDMHDNEAEAEQINIVSASQQAPTKDDQSHLMHEVHHETSDGAVFSSSGEQDPLQDDISSGTDVDMPACQNQRLRMIRTMLLRLS